MNKNMQEMQTVMHLSPFSHRKVSDDFKSVKKLSQFPSMQETKTTY